MVPIEKRVGEMLNIVIPMAGYGMRFASAGYELPKPLIDVHGKTMIECVIKNIQPTCSHRFIFICLKKHVEQYQLDSKLRSIAKDCIIILIDQVTEGAACTVLLAEQYIDNGDSLMIANADQYVDINIDDYLSVIKEYDGLIMTMTANDSKWSFVKCDNSGFVTMLREKEVISNEATVGIYNYSKGEDFVKYAKQMIDANRRVNGEFYVAPVYNEMIEAGKKIVCYNVGSEDDGMYGLGIPEDLDKFLLNPLSQWDR